MFLYSFQDFQRDLVKVAEVFTAIGYKHIEAGENSFLIVKWNVITM